MEDRQDNSEPEKIDLNRAVPGGKISLVKDHIALYVGAIILVVAMVLCAAFILTSTKDEKGPERAWNLLFLLVGYAGAYIFPARAKG